MTITREQAKALLVGTTKGPLRVRVNSRDDQDTCDLSICGDIFVLANLKGPQYEHQHPNAYLFAAAPDLARALIASEEAREVAERDAALWRDAKEAVEFDVDREYKRAEALAAEKAALEERVRVLLPVVAMLANFDARNSIIHLRDLARAALNGGQP